MLTFAYFQTHDTIRKLENDLNGTSVIEVKSEAMTTATPVIEPNSAILVKGEAFLKLPEDLYIPPDALRVFLEAFEGPLDLLLYLIKKQNMDILDISIAKITQQYIEYVDLMRTVHFELAAEYLVMAAMLAEIKSRMLLPKPLSQNQEDEIDPAAELVKRLQEYERFKQAAMDLDELPRLQRDIFPVKAQEPAIEQIKPLPQVDLKDLFAALSDVLQRIKLNKHHHVKLESLSVRERMTTILDRVEVQSFIEFSTLFSPEEGRLGVVVTFLAVLELLKQTLIEIVQNEPFSPIHIKAAIS